jgi:hypothetical protein
MAANLASLDGKAIGRPNVAPKFGGTSGNRTGYQTRSRAARPTNLWALETVVNALTQTGSGHGASNPQAAETH